MTCRAPSRNRSLGLLVAAVLVLSSCTALADPQPGPEGSGATAEQRPTTTLLDLVSPAPSTPAAPTPPTTPTTTTPDTTTPAPSDPTPPSAAGTFHTATTAATIGGCEIFPPEHYLNATNIDRAPRHRDSDALLATIAGEPLRLPSSRIWQGSRSGMPINIVDSSTISTSAVHITGEFSRAYRGRYPIPRNPLVEGHPGRAWDAHLLMVDVADCTAYELIQYSYSKLFSAHLAWNGATYPLDTVDKPRQTTNSPDTPMIGQYLMREDVRRGHIPNVISWCTDRTGPAHMWPARDSDGTVPGGVPMGTWLRLKPSVDRSGHTGGAAALLEALATRGMVLTDTCGHSFDIYHEMAEDWPEAELEALSHLTVDDFEVIDASALRADETTFAVR